VDPSLVTTYAGGVFVVDVVVEAGSQPVDGAEAHLDFDAGVLQVVEVTAGTTLPSEIQSIFDNAAGTVDYAAGVLTGDPPAGTFVLATIRFQALASTVGLPTPLSFAFAAPRITDLAYQGSSILSSFADGAVMVEEAVTLAGSVSLQGRPPAPDPSWSIPLSFTVHMPGDPAPLFSFTPSTDSSGDFSVTGLPAGSYDLKVKNAHTLRNRYSEISLVPGPQSVHLGTLFEGDGNGDNIVNILDFSLLRTFFGLPEGNPSPDENVDFNGDGRVNISDFSLMRTNFGMAGDIDVVAGTSIGDEPWPPSGGPEGGTVTLLLSPASQRGSVGDTTYVDIIIKSGSQAVDGVEVHLDFDPAVLGVRDEAGQPAESIIGGTALPDELLNLVDSEQGRIDYAAGVLQGPLPSGTFVVATVPFEVLAAHPSDVLLSVVTALPRKTDITFEGASTLGAYAGARVSACLLEDVDCDCQVDVHDVMEVVHFWHNPAFDPILHDLDRDGDVDIIDVQMAVRAWGSVCSPGP